VPTALPSGYETAAPPSPTEAAPKPGEHGEAPEKGMTLKELLEWIRYILEKAFQGHTEAGGASPPKYEDRRVKRSHPRALKLKY
jgi:hypothetical protein